MDRAHSNTLWMRKTRITLSRPQVAGGTGTGLAAQLSKARIIQKNDDPWRCADVVGTFDGGEVVCSVAHRLPADLAAESVGAAK
jgi:hypothetical protein